MATGATVKPTLDSFANASQSQIEKLGRENKQLKQKLDQLEAENRLLKKSLFELSVKHDGLLDLYKNRTPFVLDSIENEDLQLKRDEMLSQQQQSQNAQNAQQQLQLQQQIQIQEQLQSNNNNNNENNNQQNNNVVQNSSSSNTNQSNANQSQNNSDSFSHSKPSSSSSTTNTSDSTRFECKVTLQGHKGPIHVARFSPSGYFMASGSFDKTIRIWDLSQEVARFDAHQINVSDLVWSEDNSEILSGGFDHVSKVWDVATATCLSQNTMNGFVQTVQFHPIAKNGFYMGGSDKTIMFVDRRKEGNAVTYQNESVVNSLYVYRDGMTFISADSSGVLKTWDIRKPTQPLYFSITQSTKGAPSITSLVCSPSQKPDEEGRFFGLNCADNVLRVYDRGNVNTLLQMETGAATTNKLRMIKSFVGYKNKNWPIKSSFFMGKNWSRTLDEDSHKDKFFDSCCLVATGSADHNAYIFDVGSESKLNTTPSKPLLQKLEGHQDRVYGCQFHPVRPTLLCTYSADSTIKIWSVVDSIKV